MKFMPMVLLVLPLSATSANSQTLTYPEIKVKIENHLDANMPDSHIEGPSQFRLGSGRSWEGQLVSEPFPKTYRAFCDNRWHYFGLDGKYIGRFDRVGMMIPGEQPRPRDSNRSLRYGTYGLALLLLGGGAFCFWRYRR